MMNWELVPKDFSFLILCRSHRCNSTAVAERSHPESKVRSSGCALLEQP